MDKDKKDKKSSSSKKQKRNQNQLFNFQDLIAQPGLAARRSDAFQHLESSFPEQIDSDFFSQASMDFMTESFETNMINIEKSIEKFQYNLVKIRSDFLKQINAYYAIHMKMKINYEYVRS